MYAILDDQCMRYVLSFWFILLHCVLKNINDLHIWSFISNDHKTAAAYLYSIVGQATGKRHVASLKLFTDAKFYGCLPVDAK